MFRRLILLALAGAAVGAGSFFGTLAYFDFASSPSPDVIDPVVDNARRIEILKSAIIYDEPSLRRAADNGQLETSPTLMGVLDVLERLPDGQIRLAGWVADKKGDGSPIRVLAFARGKPVLDGETRGERTDVATAFSLEPDRARNIKFELKTVCHPSEALVVAAASVSNTYVPLKATVCP